MAWFLSCNGLVLEQCCLLIWVQCRSLRWLKCSQLPFGTPAATWSKPRLRSWNLKTCAWGLLRTPPLCDESGVFVDYLQGPTEDTFGGVTLQMTLSIIVIHCNIRRSLQSVCYLKCVLLCLKSRDQSFQRIITSFKVPGSFSWQHLAKCVNHVSTRWEP